MRLKDQSHVSSKLILQTIEGLTLEWKGSHQKSFHYAYIAGRIIQDHPKILASRKQKDGGRDSVYDTVNRNCKKQSGVLKGKVEADKGFAWLISSYAK